MKVDIPVGAEVRCADGPCGRSAYVIVNPTTQQVTHLVVKGPELAPTQRLVPIELIVESTPQLILLRCTRDKLAAMESFIEYEYVPGVEPFFTYAADEYLMWPYVIPETTLAPMEHERIPPGELAVRRGARVEATDGPVGQVDEFLVDPPSGHITHLILRKGHLWGQKDVTIPVSQIARIEANIVHLKLDKHSIEALPAIPVRREIEK
jgi:sporulation protein YlmC with PRC-barrel domain